MPLRPVYRHAALAAAAGLVSCTGAAAAPRADAMTLHAGGATIEVDLASGHLDLSRAELMAWVSSAASAVTAYFDRFPVPRFRILIEPVPGKTGVLTGTTWAQGGAHATVYVGEHTRVD